MWTVSAVAWKDVSVMSRRLEFVVLASAEGANVSELCGRFGVSRKTGYKWLSRFAIKGNAGLVDQSRRPWESAGRTSDDLEQRVLALRVEHPAWGGRKLRRRLQDLQHIAVPVASTITAILRSQRPVLAAAAGAARQQQSGRDDGARSRADAVASGGRRNITSIGHVDWCAEKGYVALTAGGAVCWGWR